MGMDKPAVGAAVHASVGGAGGNGDGEAVCPAVGATVAVRVAERGGQGATKRVASTRSVGYRPRQRQRTAGCTGETGSGGGR